MADVLLVGGPLDGTTVYLEPTRQLVTYTVPASYRRVDDHTFVHCRTPTTIGDNDLAFPESQLLLEELPRVRNDD